MKIIKPLLCFFISLLMVLDLFLLQLSMFTHNRLYNSNYYIQSYEVLDFYSYINDSISKQIGIVQRECNLPKDIFDNIYNKNSIENNVNKFTEGTIDYLTYKTSKLPASDVSTYTNEVNKRIDNFLSTSNVTLDSSSKSDIENIKSQIATVSKNNIYVANFDKLSQISSFDKARSYLYKLYSYEYLFIGIFIILTIILLLLQVKNFFIFVTWFSSSLIAGGLLIFIPFKYLARVNYIDNLALSPPKFRLLAGTILTGYLQNFIDISMYITIIGIIIFTVNMLFGIFRTSLKKA